MVSEVLRMLGLVLVLVVGRVAGDCVWYDECGPNPDLGKYILPQRDLEIVFSVL